MPAKFKYADRRKDRHDENNRNFARTRKDTEKKFYVLSIEIFKKSGFAYKNISDINYISLLR